MALGTPTSLQDFERGKFVESTTTTGKPVVAVANSDGSDIGGAGEYNATLPTYTDGDKVKAQYNAKGAALVDLQTALDKTNDSITAYESPSSSTVVDLATDADVVVSASAAVLLGVYFSTTSSAHAALIKDSAGTKLSLGASTPIGTYIDCKSVSMANITVESDNSGTGTITVFWRAV